jgi:hypothetical protein
LLCCMHPPGDGLMRWSPRPLLQVLLELVQAAAQPGQRPRAAAPPWSCCGPGRPALLARPPGGVLDDLALQLALHVRAVQRLGHHAVQLLVRQRRLAHKHAPVEPVHQLQRGRRASGSCVQRGGWGMGGGAQRWAQPRPSWPAGCEPLQEQIQSGQEVCDRAANRAGAAGAGRRGPAGGAGQRRPGSPATKRAQEAASGSGQRQRPAAAPSVGRCKGPSTPTCANMTASLTLKRVLRKTQRPSLRRLTTSRPYCSRISCHDSMRVPCIARLTRLPGGGGGEGVGEVRGASWAQVHRAGRGVGAGCVQPPTPDCNALGYGGRVWGGVP